MQIGMIDRTPRGRVATQRAYEYFRQGIAEAPAAAVLSAKLMLGRLHVRHLLLAVCSCKPQSSLLRNQFPGRREAKFAGRKTSSYILRFGFLRVRAYLRAIMPFEKVLFSKG